MTEKVKGSRGRGVKGSSGERQRVGRLEGWRVRGLEKAKDSRIWKRKGSRSQGFEGSSGERQKTEDRRQETEDRRQKTGDRR